MAIIGMLMTVAGYSVAQTLLDIKTSMKEISKELRDTVIDFASFTSATRTRLEDHSKRLDIHDETFKRIHK
jgi:hypothetical protein